MHQWNYLETTMLNEVQKGPVTEDAMKELALAGKLKADSKIMSPTRTKGQWTTVKAVPGFLKLIDQGTQQRAAERQSQLEEKRIAKSEAAEAKRDAAPADSSRQHKIRQHVEQFLTAGERIEEVFVQFRPVIIKADAAVVTNKRLLIVHPKLLGRFDFDDFLWRDLGDAHVSEDILGSTFFATHVSGKKISIAMLPKIDCRRLYQIAQQREEEAIEVRRTRTMEESAAGATRINVGTSAPAANSAGDPMARIKQLKEMLEAGLIDEQEFASKKSSILSEI